jgi:hypothetical protein
MDQLPPIILYLCCPCLLCSVSDIYHNFPSCCADWFVDPGSLLSAFFHVTLCRLTFSPPHRLNAEHLDPEPTMTQTSTISLFPPELLQAVFRQFSHAYYGNAPAQMVQLMLVCQKWNVR